MHTLFTIVSFPRNTIYTYIHTYMIIEVNYIRRTLMLNQHPKRRGLVVLWCRASITFLSSADISFSPWTVSSGELRNKFLRQGGDHSPLRS